MKLSQIKQNISNGNFDKTFNLLYEDTESARARFDSALQEFYNLFGEKEDIRLFSAPGRTEIGGNHTDHQHGLVLAGSVNLDVIAVVAENQDGIVRIKSQGYPQDTVNITELEPQASEKGCASALIRGVLAAFKQNGYNIGGFDAYTTSNVLKGSGLSSSAAFEVLVSNIVNGLLNQI